MQNQSLTGWAKAFLMGPKWESGQGGHNLRRGRSREAQGLDFKNPWNCQRAQQKVGNHAGDFECSQPCHLKPLARNAHTAPKLKR
jgi:hypothetical protein